MVAKSDLAGNRPSTRVASVIRDFGRRRRGIHRAVDSVIRHWMRYSSWGEIWEATACATGEPPHPAEGERGGSVLLLRNDHAVAIGANVRE